MKNFKTLWNLFGKKDQKNFSLLIILYVIQSFLEVISIAAVIPFITVIFSPESLSKFSFLDNYSDYFLRFQDDLLLIFCSIFLGIFIFKNLSLIWINNFKNNFVNIFKVEISKRILIKYFSQDFLFFSKNKQGKFLTILGSETHNLTHNLLDPIIILISEILILVGIFILIIISGYNKGLIVILPILFSASFILKSINKKIRGFSHMRVEIAENISTYLIRVYQGIRDVFLSNNAKSLADKISSYGKKQAHIEIKNSNYQLLPKAILEILGLLILLILVVYFVKIGVDKSVILTNLTFYFVIAYRSIPSYNKILIQYQRINFSINSLDIINSTLQLKDKRSLQKLKNSKIEFKDSIELKNIFFSYDSEKNLFENIDLKLKKREIVGVCGESGSGKSTLLNLITLLIKPDKGNFYLDNKVMKDHDDIKGYQDLIRFISQDTFLIDDTIKNNITFEEESHIDNDKLNSAIKFAQLDQFINSLPEGLNYMVGSQSRRISSGQKQRIAIARAIYNSKEILIFDEATNALDYKTEKKIIENIYLLKNKHTIILVSHEMRNLEECDIVYELKDHKIKCIKSKLQPD